MNSNVLFINAINLNREGESAPPLGLGYLVSSLRKEFGNHAINFKIINKDIEQEIKDFKPDLVGISSATKNYGKAIEYSKIAKRYDLPVIIGGEHISMLPSSLSGDMDVAVIGEGEATIIDLFDLFEKEGVFDKDRLRKIDGVAFKDGSRIALTKRRKPIEPLDSIPLPARDLFDIGLSTHMFTSRGCPYRCAFCSSSRFWSNVRFFSAEYVVNEIKCLIEEYHVKNIYFFDDLFTINKTRMKQTIELLKQEDILGEVFFHCNVRANTINHETLQLLKTMNVKSVSIGLESGSTNTLKYLKGDTVTVRDNANAVKLLKKYGIDCQASFIIGSPEEKEEDILTTLKFIKENPIDSFIVFVLTPFPNTPIWEYAKEKKLVSDNMDWEKLDMTFADNYKESIFLSQKISRKRLHELFLLFKKEQRNRRIKFVLKTGLRFPYRVPSFLAEKIRWHFNGLKSVSRVLR